MTDDKGVSKMRKSNYRRQYNDQKENDKMSNNELQNTT
jgi:hypothetical protein